jgi:hypothetical protein
MVAPFNYALNVASPFEQAVRGLQLGTAQRGAELAQEEMQFQRQLREQQMAAAQAKEQQALLAQQQREQTISAFMAVPRENRTYDDYLRLSMVVPKETLNSLRGIDEQRSSEARAGDARLYSQAAAAIKSGKPELARSSFIERADAETDSARKKQFQTLAEVVTQAPDLAFDNIVMTMAGLGGDYASAAKNIFEMGKKPELKKGFAALSTQEAKARGLPTDGFTYQINQDTGQVDVLTRPERGPSVVVTGERQPTEFEKEFQKSAAKIATEWTSGGATSAAANIARVQDVVSQLESQPALTGAIKGSVPESLKPFLVPKTLALTQNAERVLQEGIRGTIGAQVTANEVKQFLERSFDPKLGGAENARRLKLLSSQLNQSYQQKKDMIDYIRKNRTLEGFEGPQPNLDDFYKALGTTPAGGQDVRSQADAIISGGRR